MDTRTPAERAYDQTRLSRTPATDPWDAIIDILVTDDDGRQPTSTADQPSALLLELAAFIAPYEPAEDDAARSGTLDARFDRAVDQVSDLPDDLRARAVSLWEGFLTGVAIAPTA